MARLSPQDLSARWGGSPNVDTLTVWRARRKGPAYYKVGKTIWYDEPDIERYEQERRFDPAKLRPSRRTKAAESTAHALQTPSEQELTRRAEAAKQRKRTSMQTDSATEAAE